MAWREDATITKLRVHNLITGKSAIPTVLKDYSDHTIDLYTSSASTDASNSVKPIYLLHTVLGAGGVGHRAEFHTRCNVAAGPWINALKGYMEFDNAAGTGTAGRTTGLASAVCAEMKMPNAAVPTGEYYPLEVEWIGQTNSGPGVSHGFITARATGIRTNFNASGYFLDVQGLAAGATAMLSATSQTLKTRIGASTTRYLFMSQVADTISIGLTGGKKTLVTGVPEIAVWSTSALAVGTQDIVKIDFTQTQAVTSGYIKGFRCTMTSAVCTPGSFNGIKGIIDYSTAGYAHGDCAPVASELLLPDTNMDRGSYACFEAQIDCPSGTTWVNSDGVSFFRCKINGTKAAFDAGKGYLFDIQGVTEGSNIFIDSDGETPSATGGIRCQLGTSEIWLLYRDTAPG